jgi:hypothetical protein
LADWSNLSLWQCLLAAFAQSRLVVEETKKTDQRGNYTQHAERDLPVPRDPSLVYWSPSQLDATFKISSTWKQKPEFRDKVYTSEDYLAIGDSGLRIELEAV